jgi:hypothetical protein
MPPLSAASPDRRVALLLRHPLRRAPGRPWPQCLELNASTRTPSKTPRRSWPCRSSARRSGPSVVRASGRVRTAGNTGTSGESAATLMRSTSSTAATAGWWVAVRSWRPPMVALPGCRCRSRIVSRFARCTSFPPRMVSRQPADRAIAAATPATYCSKPLTAGGHGKRRPERPLAWRRSASRTRRQVGSAQRTASTAPTMVAVRGCALCGNRRAPAPHTRTSICSVRAPASLGRWSMASARV